MKMIKLTMATGQTRVEMSRPDENGEDDGLDRIEEVTKPVILDATQVRNFYPRRENRVGTRILFRSGSALAVTETFDAVEAAIREALTV